MRAARSHRALVAGLAQAVLGSVPVLAGADEARAMTGRAAAHIAEVGRDQAFADFSRPDGGFVDGEMYVFCVSAGGVTLANGGNPKLVGRNLNGVRSPDGTMPNDEILRVGLAQGEGWIEYRWPNPATRRIASKVVFVRRVAEDVVCGSGYYRNETP